MTAATVRTTEKKTSPLLRRLPKFHIRGGRIRVDPASLAVCSHRHAALLGNDIKNLLKQLHTDLTTKHTADAIALSHALEIRSI